MPIATTTALLLGSAIAAGSQVAGSAIASHGAKAAAKTQAGAANDALGEVRHTMDPYLNVGGQAITALGSAMGLPSGPVGGGAQGAPGAPEMTDADRYRALGMAQPQLGGAGAAPGGYSGNSPYASAGTYPNYAPQSDPQQHAMQQSASSYSGQNGAPKLVTMRAPTGETQLVPEQYVDHLTAKGATVVG